MKYSKNIWDQLRNKKADDLISALKKDGWKIDYAVGSEQIFRNTDGRRVSIHYHPSKTFGPNLLKGLLDDIGWSEQDMRRIKLVK